MNPVGYVIDAAQLPLSYSGQIYLFSPLLTGMAARGAGSPWALMAFSTFKACLRRRAARSFTKLWEAIAQATDIFTPAERQTTSLLQDTAVSDRKR